MKKQAYKSLVVIPARAGSKRLPGKNVRPMNGRPLLMYALDAALGSRLASRCVVSSDDQEVLALVRSVDSTLALARPPELAGDDSPSIDAVRHALRVLEEAGEGPFDATVIVQVTNPLVLPADIDACLECLVQGADSAVTIVPVGPIHPAKLKRLEGNRLRPYFSSEVQPEAARVQDLPEAFVRSGSVYATSRATLERNSLYGEHVGAVLVPRDRAVDIDEEVDFAWAEFLLTRHHVGALGQGHKA